MGDIKRILVRSGITKYCRKVVHTGISLAKKYDAELYIIHVISNPFGLKGWNLPMLTIKGEYEKILDDVNKDIDRIISMEKKNGVTIHKIIRDGDPIEEILNVIETEKIDLLVIPSHPENRLMHIESRMERYLFGWDNDVIIRKMPCSIYLVQDSVNI